MPRITITEPGRSPQPYRLKLDRESTTIGRASDNDIQIEAGSASTHHCVMKRVSGGFILEDLNSTNGIKVDDTRYQVIDLEDGLTVKFGDDVDFNFTLTDEEQDELSEEEFTSHEKVQFPKSQKPEPEEEDFEDDDDDFEEAPRRKKEEQPKPKPVAPPQASYTPPQPVKASGGGASTILFLILCAAALVLGLVVRHYQEHKTFLFAKPAQATPAAPADTPADAE